MEFVADRLLYSLGYPKYYNTGNPFPFMETISLQGKISFFERRNTNYAVANVMSKKEDREFNLDCAF